MLPRVVCFCSISLVLHTGLRGQSMRTQAVVACVWVLVLAWSGAWRCDHGASVAVSLPGTSAAAACASSSTPRETLKFRRRGWTWAREKCSGEGLVVSLTAGELKQGRLLVETLDHLLATFRTCGVVAIRSVVPAPVVARLQEGLNDTLAPYVASRSRVRGQIARAARVAATAAAAAAGAVPGDPAAASEAAQRAWRASYDQEVTSLWQEIASDSRTRGGDNEDEALFTLANTVRERNDGRVDVALPCCTSPFNDTSLTFSPFIYPVLTELLGLDLRLKRLNAVVALTEQEGVANQHWHRDADLLFAPDGVFQDDGVHRLQDGVRLPPYAINVFVPLVDMTPENGPTEFTLGSHQWGTDWSLEEEGAVDRRFFVPAGSAIIADYRTVHRGTINRGSAARPIAMLIYGREWWSDRVNYGAANVGGARRVERRYGSYEAMVSQLEGGGSTGIPEARGGTSTQAASIRSDATSAQRAHAHAIFEHRARLWEPRLRQEAMHDRAASRCEGGVSTSLVAKLTSGLRTPRAP